MSTRKTYWVIHWVEIFTQWTVLSSRWIRTRYISTSKTYWIVQWIVIIWLVKWYKIQEIHRHSYSLLYVDSHSQALFPFTKITVQVQDGWMDLCTFNLAQSTIPFNFIEWFMILFSFSDVKYSFSILCVDYVLTYKNIIFQNQTRKGPSMLDLLRGIEKYPHTCLGLYLFTKMAKWQQLVWRNYSMTLHLSYLAQTLIIIYYQ